MSTIFALWEGAAWWRPCHKKFQSVLEEKIVKNGDVGIDRDYDEDENGIKEDGDDDAMQICRILAIFFRRKMVLQ